MSRCDHVRSRVIHAACIAKHMRLPAAAGRGGVYHGDHYGPNKRNTLH